MPIDLNTALGAELPSQVFSWTASDVALYALGVGAAGDPMDTTGLEYIHDAEPVYHVQPPRPVWGSRAYTSAATTYGSTL